MTIPLYEPAIETVQQLIDSNTIWAAPHVAWIYSINQINEVSQ